MRDGFLKPRVYIDTSVIGGCFDEEFAEWSLALFDEFEASVKTAVFSDVTIDELEFAPSVVQGKWLNLSDESKEFVVTNQEAQELAQHCLDEKIVSEKYRGDALHIATATVHRVDILVSWNFKHIVNYNRMRLFHAVNLKFGYPALEIRSPREILNDDGKAKNL